MGSPRKCSGECFRSASWDSQKSAPGSAPESAWEIGIPPGSAPESVFLSNLVTRKSALGSTPWGSPNFPGTLGSTPRGTFWESTKSTRQSTFGVFFVKHSCKLRVGSQLKVSKPLCPSLWHPYNLLQSIIFSHFFYRSPLGRRNL